MLMVVVGRIAIKKKNIHTAGDCEFIFAKAWHAAHFFNSGEENSMEHIKPETLPKMQCNESIMDYAARNNGRLPPQYAAAARRALKGVRERILAEINSREHYNSGSR
jgi:hypothetical protein